ncbi:MAG: HrpE/YscL family type III secretion apparatus protein [Rhabdochlamydiaceae bacterium]|nr:HrpE/YscL family type III secretion apparatus protein [Rhabdochlamydiaceae bacterium]
MSRLFTLIESEEVHPSSDKKVIKSEDFSTLLAASDILEKTRADIVEVKERAEKEAEDLKKKGYDDGYQEGLAQLNEMILGLDNEKKRLRHEMNQLILPLALKAAKKIVAGELKANPETIVNIVMQALAPVMQNHKITIFVNKADKEILEAEKTLLKEKLEQVESLSIRDRDDISPGGCMIETESGIINATIENQWRGIESAFDRYLKQ